MPLPVWLAALIPYNMIRRVNDLIEGDLTHKAHPGDQVYDLSLIHICRRRPAFRR